MHAEITDALAKLEVDKNIRVLYAVESGSRAWGFASTDSDWDVRFIYVHNPDWYLAIDEQKDNIEQMLPHDIDLAGWELKKALRLFRKSNPPLLEWLRSPIIYKESGGLANDLRVATKEYFNPKSCLYHYFYMARRNWEAYFKGNDARLKKYFYILRPIMACEWIERTGEMAPMELATLFNAQEMPAETRNAITELLERKMQGDELSVGPRINVVDQFIADKFSEIQNILSGYDLSIQPDTVQLNKIFKSTLQQAWSK